MPGTSEGLPSLDPFWCSPRVGRPVVVFRSVTVETPSTLVTVLSPVPVVVRRRQSNGSYPTSLPRQESHGALPDDGVYGDLGNWDPRDVGP